jgi:hypothetical protein
MGALGDPDFPDFLLNGSCLANQGIKPFFVLAFPYGYCVFSLRLS